MAHRLDNLYAGRPVYIISTGTSLRGFDFERLNGKITVGINRVVEYYHPAVMHFIDFTAHKTHARALLGYNGMIIAGPSAAPAGTHDNAFEVGRNLDTFELSGEMTELSEKVGRSFDEGLYGGGAGCTALHTAILLGGDPVYLLGYDYYEDNGIHFDEYDETRNGKNVEGYSYAVSFAGVEHISRQPWIPKIYNCNPDSRLKCFEHADLEALLPRRA
jgi:hypothetical protein